MKRRQALHTLSGAFLTLTLEQHQSLAQIDWQPKVLSDHGDRTVDVFSELIIPRTDTPGAHDARVHRYIDFVLEKGLLEGERERFLDGLDWLDRHCRDVFGASFAALSKEQQTGLLTELSGDSDADSQGKAFFRQIKDLTIRGYYTSREGLLEELEYQGNSAMAEFPGCTHPEHQR